MKKVFKITNICPFDLLRWEKYSFYNYLDQVYLEKFGKEIEILEADLSFILDGVKCKIITYQKRELKKC